MNNGYAERVIFLRTLRGGFSYLWVTGSFTNGSILSRYIMLGFFGVSVSIIFCAEIIGASMQSSVMIIMSAHRGDGPNTSAPGRAAAAAVAVALLQSRSSRSRSTRDHTGAATGCSCDRGDLRFCA